MWWRKSTDSTSVRMEWYVECEINKLYEVKTADDGLRTWWSALSLYLHKTETVWRKTVQFYRRFLKSIWKVNIWCKMVSFTATSGFNLNLTQVEPICIWMTMEQWRDCFWNMLTDNVLAVHNFFQLRLLELNASWCSPVLIKIPPLASRSL